MSTNRTESINEKHIVKDERQQALEKNPCGMCRALGFAICKGHGGGGSDPDEIEKEPENKIEAINTPLEATKLFSYLEKSPVWILNDDFKYTFSHELSILSITLDVAKGKMHFNSKAFLSADDEKNLEMVYTKITEELKNFINEVKADDITFSKTGNDLKINIPNQTVYDQFLARLLDKNLIPDNDYYADLVKGPSQNTEHRDDKKTDSSYQSPNPFNISKGPSKE